LPLWWDESTLLAKLSHQQTEIVSEALERLARGQHVEAQNARLAEELAGALDRLQEVHHRVRNHLQAVTGLLSVHEAKESSPAARQALRQSIARLTSIAAVHDLLARDPESGALRLPELAERLSQHLLAQAGTGGRIRVRAEVAAVSLAAKEATAFVLVLTELLSNAIEHGFPDGGAGEISVCLTVAAEAARSGPRGSFRVRGAATQSGRLVACPTEAVLLVRDSGRGLPLRLCSGLAEGLHVADWESATLGLGLRLVWRLVERDLRGSIEAWNDNGACFRIAFPVVGEPFVSPQGGLRPRPTAEIERRP
jgi:two-component sensor histidine kinase